jgi:hypothetical protein
MLAAPPAMGAAEAPALWGGSAAAPGAGELEDAAGARFHVIKAHEPERDGGYRFLHGVGLAWHQGKLYASFGHNKGIENTSGEEGRFRVSADGGRTWGEVYGIDSGEEAPDLAVSHGSFLSHEGRLWAFLGAFHGARERVHTRAYVLKADGVSWERKGTVIGGGFWPMQEPLRLPGGDWIMAGLMVGNGDPAAVAISRGSDFTQWQLAAVPRAAGVGKMWGESTVIVEGRRILIISRYGAEAMALVSASEDGGRTWSEMLPSNLPMVTSKPYAGTLSTGQRYLIGTTTAVSAAGGGPFRRIFRIRDAVFPSGPGESHPRAALSYPYAVEHEGHLYVGYSNNGGRTGMNLNSAELAVVPVASLRARA